jgi:hypothetical protein
MAARRVAGTAVGRALRDAEPVCVADRESEVRDIAGLVEVCGELLGWDRYT